MITCRNLFRTFNAGPTLLPSWNSLITQIGLTHTLKLERAWEIPITKNGRRTKIKRRHNIYKVVGVEYGPKELSVILTEDSSEFGANGELVSLPKRFSRMLLASGKAVYASPENIQNYTAREMTQTISGRRMELWLKEHGNFLCHLPFSLSWNLTPEIMARCLLREHELSVPPSAVTLPEYPITNETIKPNEEHEIQISVNRCDPIPITVSIHDRDKLS